MSLDVRARSVDVLRAPVEIAFAGTWKDIKEFEDGLSEDTQVNRSVKAALKKMMNDTPIVISAAQIEEKEAALELLKEQLAQKQAEVTAIEFSNTEAAVILDAKDQELKNRSESVALREAEATQRENASNARKIVLDTRESDLDALQSMLDSRTSELDARQAALDAREAELDAREAAIPIEPIP